MTNVSRPGGVRKYKKKGGLGFDTCQEALSKAKNIKKLSAKFAEIDKKYNDTPVVKELATMIGILSDLPKPVSTNKTGCIGDIMKLFNEKVKSPVLLKKVPTFVLTVNGMVDWVLDNVNDVVEIITKEDLATFNKKDDTWLLNMIRYCTTVYAHPATQGYIYTKYQCPLRFVLAHYAMHRSKLLNVIVKNSKYPITTTTYPIPHTNQLYIPMMCSVGIDNKPADNVFGNFDDDAIGQVMDALVQSRSAGDSPVMIFEEDKGGKGGQTGGGGAITYKLSKEFKYIEIPGFKAEIKNASKYIESNLTEANSGIVTPVSKGGAPEPVNVKANAANTANANAPVAVNPKEAQAAAKKAKENGAAAKDQAAKETATANKLMKLFQIYANDYDMLKSGEENNSIFCYKKDHSTSSSDKKSKFDITQFSPNVARQVIDDYICYLYDDSKMSAHGQKSYLSSLFQMSIDAVQKIVIVEMHKSIKKLGNSSKPAELDKFKQILKDVEQYSIDGVAKLSNTMPKLIAYFFGNTSTYKMDGEVWNNHVTKLSIIESFIETIVPIAQQIYKIVDALFGSSSEFYTGQKGGVDLQPGHYMANDANDGRPRPSTEESLESGMKSLENEEKEIEAQLNRISMIIEVVMRQQLIMDILVDLLTTNFDKTLKQFLEARAKMTVLHNEKVDLIFEDIIIKVIKAYFKIRTPVYIRIKSYALMKKEITGIVEDPKNINTKGKVGKDKICAIIDSMFKNIEEKVLKTLTDDLKEKFFKSSNQRLVTAVNELVPEGTQCKVGASGGSAFAALNAIKTSKSSKIIKSLKFKPTSSFDVIKAHQRIIRSLH